MTYCSLGKTLRSLKTSKPFKNSWMNLVFGHTQRIKPLAWENKASKITNEITYTAVDENVRYMYGIVEKRNLQKR